MKENEIASIKIEESWKLILADTFKAPFFDEVKTFLQKEKQAGKTIYPPGNMIFQAFNITPFQAVKVVIIGQDPYHNPGEAMGLSFSVPRGKRIPPSLVNIYKEIQSDLGLPMPTHGDLSHWATQGVLLLNAMLTVQANAPASHQHIGWQHFTDAVIKKLSDERSGLVFLLWGNLAKSKKELIDGKKHTVLEAAHPSPLARNAFSGCKHFSKTNDVLLAQGVEEIDWRVE